MERERKLNQLLEALLIIWIIASGLTIISNAIMLLSVFSFLEFSDYSLLLLTIFLQIAVLTASIGILNLKKWACILMFLLAFVNFATLFILTDPTYSLLSSFGFILFALFFFLSKKNGKTAYDIIMKSQSACK